jgi:hypothetical protein
VDIRGIQKGTWQVACRRHLALTVPRALHDRWNGKLQESNQLQRQGNDLPDVSSDVLIPLQLKTSTKHTTWCHRFSLRRALSSGGRKTNNSFLVSPLWQGSILLYRHHPLASSDSSAVSGWSRPTTGLSRMRLRSISCGLRTYMNRPGILGFVNILPYTDQPHFRTSFSLSNQSQVSLRLSKFYLRI